MSSVGNVAECWEVVPGQNVKEGVMVGNLGIQHERNSVEKALN